MKLNIQLFAEGIINGSSTASNCDCRILWSSVGDTSTNKSSVIAQVQIYKSGSSSTTGTFSGTVTVNGVSTNISKKFSPYNWGSWATVGYSIIEVQHESDGTKQCAISCKLKQTGTSMAGTYTASDTVTLDTLHKKPLISSYSITETNSFLVSAGVSNNVFVANLSKKSININYTLYDNATLSEAGVTNGTNVVSGSSLPLLLDYTQIPLALKENLVGELKVPIFVRIVDSMGATTIYSTNYSQQITMNDYYDYIAYTPVSVTNSNTKAKRDGQTSGKVKLTIDGNLFNGQIGNVSQSSYKPTIKYKFWKVGDTEPSTYSRTISSSRITISNGNFTVSDYQIGTTTESSTNYFNPDYAYKVKVQVSDNFTTTESAEIQIPVGEALWTEYRDRVDFKKATLKNSLDLYNTNAVNDTTVIEDSSTIITFSPTSGSSYSGYGGCYYYKIGTRVHLHLGLSGLSNAYVTVYTLPAGYRPYTAIGTYGVSNTMTSYCSLQVGSDGTVSVRPTGGYALIDIEFDAFN